MTSGILKVMSDEIPVGDTIYVSSKRASDISGYAQDYIGQLARSNQIDAKRIGGLWYVDMLSLEAYKTRSPEENKITSPQIREVVEKEKEADVLVSFDGKDYISANRASKITGYNQDYVGQLARSGKILSRQVGNRWYVDRDGILAHKNEKDRLLAAVQSESVGLQLQKINTANENLDQERIINEASLLKYQSEEVIFRPAIDKEEILALEIRTLDKEVKEPLSSDEYEIPVQIRRRSPDYEENPTPIDLRRPRSDQGATTTAQVTRITRTRKKRNKGLSLRIGGVVAGVILVTSLGALYLRISATTDGAHISRLSIAANALSSGASQVSDEFLSWIEDLIVPTLYYQRSQ